MIHLIQIALFFGLGIWALYRLAPYASEWTQRLDDLTDDTQRRP